MNTVHTKTINSLSIICYNKIPFMCKDKVIYNNKKYEGYYISYNNYDIDTYGSDTTALVLGLQMNKFFILNGNHIEQYKKLSTEGFNACLEYYKNNTELQNKFSDKI